MVNGEGITWYGIESKFVPYAFTASELIGTKEEPGVLTKIVFSYYDRLFEWVRGECGTMEINGVKVFDPKLEYQPVLLIGGPGIAKSDTVRSVRELVEKMLRDKFKMNVKLDLIDLRISQLDPTDIKGLPLRPKKVKIKLDEYVKKMMEVMFELSGRKEPVPDYIEEEIVEWAIPEFLPRSGLGILFLDEINLGSPSVLAAFYQLILDRKVGTKYELPVGWIIISAMNPPEIAEIAQPLPPPLINRFRIIWVIPPKGKVE